LLDLTTIDTPDAGHVCIVAHPLVVDVCAALTSKDPSARHLVADTIVQLLATAVRHRDPEDVDDARWLALVAPHIAHALDHVADLPQTSTVTLIDTSNRVAPALGVIGGDYLGYLAIAEQTRTVAIARLKPDHLSTLTARHGYAAALALIGRYDQAQVENLEVARARHDLLGACPAVRDTRRAVVSRKRRRDSS
jgi:hypothetical protein